MILTLFIFTSGIAWGFVLERIGKTGLEMWRTKYGAKLPNELAQTVESSVERAVERVVGKL